jgi:hypothetical protein
MAGSISKFNFTNALRRLYERRGGIRLPDFEKQFAYAYDNWCRITNVAADRMEDMIYPPKAGVKSETQRSRLENIDPACFCRKDGDKGPIFVAGDGNMQCWRLNTRGSELDLPPPFGRIISPPIDSSGLQEVDKELGGCASFLAAKENIRAIKPATQKYKDETGIFGMQCGRHQIPIRYMNIYRGETLDVPMSLLKDIKRMVEELLGPISDDWLFGFQYDIACIMDKYIGKRDLDLHKTLTFCLGCWHLHAHDLKCQCTYSPYKVRLFGLTPGEGNEPDWSGKRHMIPSNRTSTAEVRTANLDNQSLWLIRKMVRELGDFLHRRWQMAAIKLQDSEHDLKALQEKSQFPNMMLFEEHIRGNAAKEVQWIKEDPVRLADDRWRKHWPLAMAVTSLKEAYAYCLRERQSQQKVKAAQDLEQVQSRVREVCADLKQNVNDWMMDDGHSPGNAYNKWKDYEKLVEISQMYREIQKEASIQEMTYERLYGGTGALGYTAITKQILPKIRKAIPKINGLIKVYNDKVLALPERYEKPQFLEPIFFTKKGVEKTRNVPAYQFEWAQRENIENLGHNGPELAWILNGDEQKAVAAWYLRERAKEEVALLKIEWQRTCYWHLSRLTRNLDLYLDLPPLELPSKWTPWSRAYFVESVLDNIEGACSLLNCETELVDQGLKKDLEGKFIIPNLFPKARLEEAGHEAESLPFCIL